MISLLSVCASVCVLLPIFFFLYVVRVTPKENSRLVLHPPTYVLVFPVVSFLLKEMHDSQMLKTRSAEKYLDVRSNWEYYITRNLVIHMGPKVLSGFMCVTTDVVWNGEWIYWHTCTHHSELQVTTAPPLISTIHKSPQHPLSLFPAHCVFTRRFLVTDFNSGDSSTSRAQSPLFTASSAELTLSWTKSQSQSYFYCQTICLGVKPLETHDQRFFPNWTLAILVIT
jgi:hypothetical protein